MLRRQFQCSRRYVNGPFSVTSPLFYASTYGLLLWLRADRGITLGATLLAAGTTPPAVTISGTATSQIGLYLQIDGAGNRGVATFKWSIDNGSTFVATGVLTAASVVLGTTGITAEFPAGAYLTDNIYQGTVSAWADQGSAGDNAAQAAAANQPILRVPGTSPNGRSSVLFDGVDDYMRLATTISNVPATLIVLAERRNNNATRAWVALDKTSLYSAFGLPWGVYANSNISSGNTLALSTLTVCSATIRAANDIDFHQNAAFVSNSVAGTGFPSRTTSDIGSGGGTAQCTEGQIVEIIIYGQALPAAAVLNLHRGIMARSGM